MLQFTMKNRGSISILLSIILLPTLAFASLVVDSANYYMSKSVAESAGELSTNAALANYDTVLHDVYGLLAMSQINGEKEFGEDVSRYFQNSLQPYDLLDKGYDLNSDILSSVQDDVMQALGMVQAKDVNRNFLKVGLDQDTFQAKWVDGSSLGDPKILKNQIVDFMKYRGPAELALGLLSSLNAFKQVNDQSEVAEKKLDVDNDVKDLGEACQKFFNEIQKYNEKANEFNNVRDGFNGNVSNMNKKLKESNELLIKYVIPDWDLSENEYVTKTGGSSYPQYSFKDVNKADVTVNTSLGTFLQIYKEFNDQINAISLKSSKVSNDIEIDEFLKEYRNYSEDLVVMKPLVKKMLRISCLCEANAYPSSSDILSNYNYSSLFTKEQIESFQKDEADNKTENKKDFFDNKIKEWQGKLEAKMKDFYDISNSMKNRMSQLKEEIANAPSKITSNMSYVYDYLKSYYDIAKDVRDQAKKAKNKKQPVMDCIAEVNTSNTSFKQSIENYKSKQSQDEYYSQMKSEADKNDVTFKVEDVDKVIEQLDAAINFVEDSNNGVLAVMDSYKFYGKQIRKDKIKSSNKAKNAMKGVLGDDFQISDHEAYYNNHISKILKSPKTKVDFYVKSLAKGNYVLDVGGGVIGVPSFYVYLLSTYGTDDGKSDKEEKNVDKALTELNEEVKEKTTKNEVAEYSNYNEIFSSVNDNSTNPDKMEFKDVGGFTGIFTQFTAMAGVVKGIFNTLTGGFTNARDNLLITQYVFENFSYYTLDKEVGLLGQNDKKRDRMTTTLTNEEISRENNAIYGCEIEYMLYGIRGNDATGWWIFKKDAQGPEANVTLVKGNIFAIRFVCNSIHALTDTEIDAATLPPAMAIQAATCGVVPYNVAQVVLKLGLAMAETSMDMSEIMDGKKVPLLKSRDTWSLSISNLSNKLVDKGKDVVGSLVDKASAEADGLINTGAKNLDVYLQDCLDNGKEWTQDQINALEANIKTELQNTVYSALNDAVSSMSKIVSDSIEGKYMEMFTNGYQYQKSVLKQEIQIEVNKFLNSGTYSDDIKAYLSGWTGQLIDCALNQVDPYFNKIKDVVNGIKEPIEIEASKYVGMIKSMNEAMQNYVNGKLTEMKDQALNIVETSFQGLSNIKDQLIDDGKTELKKLKNEAVAGIKTSINDFFDQKFPTSKDKLDIDLDKSSNKTGKMLEFGYRDYLMLFFFLELSNKQETVVGRVGNVIQINVIRGLKDYYGKSYTPNQHPKAGDFRMSDAKTYLTVDATVMNKPLLLSQELFMRGLGEDYTVSLWRYHYKTIAGY